MQVEFSRRAHRESLSDKGSARLLGTSRVLSVKVVPHKAEMTKLFYFPVTCLGYPGKSMTPGEAAVCSCSPLCKS